MSTLEDDLIRLLDSSWGSGPDGAPDSDDVYLAVSQLVDEARATAGRAAHLAEENARLEAQNAQLERFGRQLHDDYAETDQALRDCQAQLADRDAAISTLRIENTALRARADALASQRRPRTAGGAA